MVNKSNIQSKPLVLITGGAGFIGSHTGDALLEAGYRVRVLDNLDPQIHGSTDRFPTYLNPQIEYLRGDIRRPEDVRNALQDASHIYHFASLTGVGQSMYDMRDYAEINVAGTATLLEEIIKNKCPIKKFVLASSRAVYGEGTHRCPSCGIVFPALRNPQSMKQGQFAVLCPSCNRETTSVATSEDRPLIPISFYGLTKKAQEDQCHYASQTFGLPTVVLRYFNVYGSRQSLINPYTGIISIFFSRMADAKPISVYEHGLPLRDYVHVQDVVQANLKALSADLPHYTILNVGTGKSTNIVDVVSSLAHALGRQPYLLDEAEYRVGDIHSCVADITKIKKMLYYEPKVALETGIQEFVHWAREQKTRDAYEDMIERLRSFGIFSRANTDDNS